MKTSDPPVVVEQSYNVTQAELWKAITEVEQMKQWFFPQLETFEPATGSETRFTVEHDGKEYHHIWKLAEVAPPEKIVYDWSYDGIPGKGCVIWELTTTQDGSSLKLTNLVVEDFPQDDPAFQRESCENGWQYLLSESLVEHLD
jgi:uncharacterized protein YndB with AHSA1/START domain